MAHFFDSSDHHTRMDSSVGVSPPGKDFQNFKDRLHAEILRSQRRNYSFTLIHLAIDPTPADQAALREFARLLRSSIRQYDLMCPVQAGQFLLALPEAGEKFAEKIAERIYDSISGKVSPSIGIACFPHDGTNAEDLLASARQDLLSLMKLRKDRSHS